MANNTQCTVAPGTTINVATANGVGLSTSGIPGSITGDGITLNLGAATTTGALARSGATVSFEGSTLKTTATTTATAAGQIGLRSLDTDSSIIVVGSSITMGPPNGTTAASNMIGVIADSGGGLTLANTAIQMLGGTTGVNNSGLVANGANSTIAFSGGSIATLSRGSFDVLAQAGGVITLQSVANITTSGGATTGTLVGSHALYATGANSIINAADISAKTTGAVADGVRADAGGSVHLIDAQVTTTGAGQAGSGSTPSIGSHGLYALGTGSQITGSNVTVSTAGSFTSAARAEAGGTISLSGSNLSSGGTSAADTDPTSAARVMSGGSLSFSGGLLSGTGQRSDGFSVQDAGSNATISASTISATGSRANAAFIFNGGQATVSDSTLLSTGSSAVIVQDAGSSIDLTGTTIESGTGPTLIGYGLRVSAGASATMTGGSSTTTGRDSPGILAGNAMVTATNVTIVTSGPDNSIGALADLNGHITLQGGSVTTSGDSVRAASYPHALAARNPGAVLTANGTTILTTGNIAMGAVADDGGTVRLMGNSLTTHGTSSIGLFAVTEQTGAQFPANLTASDADIETFGVNAYGADAQARNDIPVETATITIDGSTVTTHGNGAVGLRSVLANYGTVPITGRGESAVIANDSTVLTEGIAAHGVLSRDNPTSVTLNGTTIMATGANAHGAVAEAGGLVVGNNAAVTASGTNGSALFVTSEAAPVSVANFNNSTLNNAIGPTIGVGGYGDVTLTNSLVQGSGEWLRVGTSGDFAPLARPEPVLTGVPDLSSDPPGAITVQPVSSAPPSSPAPGLANITVDGSTVTGSAFTAVGSVSNVVLRNNSRWNMTGNSNLTNLTNDPSLIQFSPPAGGVFKTLTVVNYTGDGTIGLNTFLGDDSSPSDQLVIDSGTATGRTGLHIANAGGPGALTTGNGIPVVVAINGGTTAAGAFGLNNVVAAGPYEYLLFRGGVTPGTENNWYLRDELGPIPPAPPVPPTPPPNPPSPPEPPPTPTPPGPSPIPPAPFIPIFRPEAAVYSKVPQLAREMGMLMLGQFHIRQGDQSLLGRDEDKNETWVRVFITGLDQRGGGVLKPSFDGTVYGVQGGIDLVTMNHDDGDTDHFGPFGGYAHTDGNVNGFALGQFNFGAGKAPMDQSSVGAYWTRVSPSNFYIDAVGMVSWYDASPHSHRGIGAHFDGQGVMLSLESGYPILLDKQWTLEPMGQIVWQSVNFGSSHDPFSTMRFDTDDAWYGRLGARLEDNTTIDTTPTQFFLQADLWRAFGGTDTTVYNDVIPLAQPFHHTDVQLGAGANAKISEGLNLYARVDYTFNIEGNYQRAIQGNVGVRFAW